MFQLSYSFRIEKVRFQTMLNNKHTCTQTQTYTHTDTHTYTHVYTHTYTHTYIHIHTYCGTYVLTKKHIFPRWLINVNVCNACLSVRWSPRLIRCSTNNFILTQDLKGKKKHLLYIKKWNFLYVFLYVCLYPNISRNTARTALKQTPKIH